MDRRTPSTENEEIELYLRTYYSLLRSSGEVEVRSLEETHAAMNSSLHPDADSPNLDIGAFVYSSMRLPACITRTRLVVLGQSEDVFERRGGYVGVQSWQPVQSAARRRKMFFDRNEILAAFIASVSDIDDLIPMLVAYQIEWNKIYHKLSGSVTLKMLLSQSTDTPLSLDEETGVMDALNLSPTDFDKLKRVWGRAMRDNLILAGQKQKGFALRLLAGSLTDYRRAAQSWWQHIEQSLPHIDFRHRPVYFVSSNTHSLVNLLSGYALSHREKLLQFLTRADPEGLLAELEQIQIRSLPGEMENLLYYLLRKQFEEEDGSGEFRLQRKKHFRDLGINPIETPQYLDVAAQVIEVNRLDPAAFDPRLKALGQEALRDSDALIFNVDYPLGMAAYHILTQVSANAGELEGFYVTGKAATLNGRIGDVMIPNVLYDEHSMNTFLFKNCFVAGDVAPYLHEGTVFDNQKGVTVRGTFLQNNRFMTLFYREGYTDIEMEAGPYLSALYENIYPKRFPADEIVNLFINAPYDLGFLHYASDTPYSRRQTLLSKSLSYFGMDSTYGCSVAILRRILSKEIERLDCRSKRIVSASPFVSGKG
jgi:hypothetical protein